MAYSTGIYGYPSAAPNFQTVSLPIGMTPGPMFPVAAPAPMFPALGGPMINPLDDVRKMPQPVPPFGFVQTGKSITVTQSQDLLTVHYEFIFSEPKSLPAFPEPINPPAIPGFFKMTDLSYSYNKKGKAETYSYKVTYKNPASMEEPPKDAGAKSKDDAKGGDDKKAKK